MWDRHRHVRFWMKFLWQNHPLETLELALKLCKAIRLLKCLHQINDLKYYGELPLLIFVEWLHCEKKREAGMKMMKIMKMITYHEWWVSEWSFSVLLSNQWAEFLLLECGTGSTCARKQDVTLTVLLRRFWRMRDDVIPDVVILRPHHKQAVVNGTDDDVT